MATNAKWIGLLPAAMTISALHPGLNVNTNSDFNGRPKTCPVGGTLRVRESTQFKKKGLRNAFDGLAETLSERLQRECSKEIRIEAEYRTRHWPEKIATRLLQKVEELALSDSRYAEITDSMCKQVSDEAIACIVKSNKNSQSAEKIKKSESEIEKAKVKLKLAEDLNPSDKNRKKNISAAQKKIEKLEKDLESLTNLTDDEEEGEEDNAEAEKKNDRNETKNGFPLADSEVEVLLSKLCEASLLAYVEKGELEDESTNAAVSRHVKETFRSTLKKGMSLTSLAREKNKGMVVNLLRILFGNMTTSSHVEEKRATICATHSFSTNKDNSYVDNLIASDDFAFDFQEKGAALITEVDYSTNVMYSYYSWDVRQAARTIANDCPTWTEKEIGIVLEEVASWFIETIALGGAGNRRSRTAPFESASTVLVEFQRKQPLSYGSAFITAVPDSGSLVRDSEDSLVTHIAKIDRVYERPERAGVSTDPKSNIGSIGHHANNIADLKKWAAGAVVNDKQAMQKWADAHGKTQNGKGTSHTAAAE